MAFKETHFATAADGTRLAWHAHGPHRPERPYVLLTNGIGTSENFWRFLSQELSEEFQVLHWDYRGHGLSDVGGADGYSLEAQARDLGVVIEAVRAHHGQEGYPHAVAFSMGVTVLLERYRTHPHEVPSMTLIAGAPDAPGSTRWLLRAAGAMKALRAALKVTTPFIPLVAPAARAIITSPFVFPVGRAVGALRSRAPRPDIDVLMRAIASMDMRAYWLTLRGLMEADANDVLPTIEVPVCIIAAANDSLVPVEQVQRMHAALPDAEWHVVDDAGHAGLLEAGPEIAVTVRRFISRHAR